MTTLSMSAELTETKFVYWSGLIELIEVSIYIVTSFFLFFMEKSEINSINAKLLFLDWLS